MRIKKIAVTLLVLIICAAALPPKVSASGKKGISLDRDSAVLAAGETCTLKASVSGYKSCTIRWETSDKSVATVKKGGIVTAVGPGSAVISVRIKGTDRKAVCRVTVTAPEQPEDENTIIVDGRVCTLTFEDDFDGTELDGTKWERCPEGPRQDMDNYWDNSMSYTDGEGSLIIETSYDAENDRVLSGAVRTKGKFEQAYGYYEIRCTVNTVPGYWTAFWLNGGGVVNETRGGRNGTEIDIMETAYFGSKEVQSTLNWDGYGSMHKSMGQVVKADVYDGGYHTFALLWTEKEYVFYIDGEETWRTDAARALGTCETPLYLKISAETGSWTGAPDPADLPDTMKVDYVRVYGLAE